MSALLLAMVMVNPLLSSKIFEEITEIESISALAATCTEMMKTTLTWIRESTSAEQFWNWRTFTMLAGMGQLEVVDWLHEHGCQWNAYTCSAAAEGGHLKVLQYLHKKGCPWDLMTCATAAERGHLKVVQYAHENGCPWDSRICNLAAEGGHLDVLRYLHEHGCPWDNLTCMWAARGGHLDVLKYAVEHGCPWDKYETCMQAALYQQNAVVRLYGSQLPVRQYAYLAGISLRTARWF